MKKIVTLLCLISSMVLVSGCTGNGAPSINKEGVEPYTLSKREQYILQAYGVQPTNSQMLVFKGPDTVGGLEIGVWKLGAENQWESIGHGGITASGK